jgi:hypothetical protein
MPRSVFIGWSIESYWFILGVLDRLPLAIASATTADVRGVFARHFAEEWDHFRYFERTLDTLDITQEQRNQAEPLPTTRAIQNWMRAAARRDVVHYAVCSGFLESTGRDRDVARTFFDRLASHYCDRGRQSVAPMAEHVSLDEAYGHGGFVEKVLGSQNKIDINRARSALNAAFGLVETLEMWSTDIVRHYSQSNSLPLTPTRAYRQLHT